MRVALGAKAARTNRNINAKTSVMKGGRNYKFLPRDSFERGQQNSLLGDDAVPELLRAPVLVMPRGRGLL